MSNVFASKHPLVAHKLARLRDSKTDPKRFRELVREIAGLLAYEATADLATTPRRGTDPDGRPQTGWSCRRRSDWFRSCAPGWGWWRGSGI